jgi:hypothetical protein
LSAPPENEKSPARDQGAFHQQTNFGEISPAVADCQPRWGREADTLLCARIETLTQEAFAAADAGSRADAERRLARLREIQATGGGAG